MAAIANPAVAAATNNDLYRTCTTGQWRQANGTTIDPHAVTIATHCGQLGDLADPEILADGVRVQRCDLSDAGLDYAVRRLAE